MYRKVTENRFAQIDNLSREAGNNLQILTDAYLLTWDDKYRVAAEKVLAATAPEKQWYTVCVRPSPFLTVVPPWVSPGRQPRQRA